MQTLKVVRSGRICEPAVSYTDPHLVFDLLGKELNRLDREHFIVLHLNAKNCLVGKETISIGSLNEATVHPREVFTGAILNKSCSVLFVHNHPSGDPKPSLADISLTRRLQESGELLGIKVLDHVVIGAQSFHSIMTATRTAAKFNRR